MNENAITISHLSKLYKLYDKPSDRFVEALGLSRKKKYTELYALNDVSFDIKKGETVGIIGKNGSGKSTILKIITGVLGKTSGDVIVDGRISALLELGAGFNMEYTGIENVYLNGTMIGFTKEEIDAKLQDILNFADIGDFVYQPVKTYSSGMFVRLAFAVAINIDPEILIVDEALSVGDVFFQAKCYHKFEEFKKQGKTILFVSHDLGSVSKYCDKVVLLNEGRKVGEGDPREMIDLYKKILVNLGGDEAGAAEGGDGTGTGGAGETAGAAGTGDGNGSSTASGGSGQGGSPDDPHSGAGKENGPTEDPVTGLIPRNPNTIEYGEYNGRITHIEVRDHNGIITSSIEKGTEFTIKMTVEFSDHVEEPIFAYTIKNLQGTDITGTNTLYEDCNVKPMDKGDIVEITFKQVMNLQGGEYLVSFGCTGYHDGDFKVFHRLYDIINITVVSDKNTVGFYDMFAETDVKYLKNPDDSGNPEDRES